ncbi:hypothetical protein ABEF92_001548 [Exophiala dermatitidis]|uniref:Zn(2)-C6 fungal-type domain-containing protein n=1 Tax=Exophiala dermatitidis (strain ATCC 34100 / CBS 525.76 / NIH/UT8656) TaxID=858893 RepID=H6C2K7_EXODN|nr:uncharacterized protein HMPREF1120_05946 [Exophiala dermatitidis NIH/UT8656]EHY57925.1 hypothetical protein HMPREF1120_05946 [Exophiala dermatitidis NIH/UT8656]
MPPRRAAHEKSRNGCLTCKIRRVKCDETTPSCRRCTESGRTCEGPVVRQFRFVQERSINQATTGIQSPQAEVSVLIPQHNRNERRAFHYFTHHAAPVYAGAVDAGFWEHLVPRLVQKYNFVWDTVVSLSYLLEHVPYAALTSPGSTVNNEHRQALRLYTRAIASLRQLAERGEIDDSVIVLSYILFASVEFQQRNIDTGTQLIKKCCKILTGNLASPIPKQTSPGGQAVHEVATPFVLRRAISIATIENAMSVQQVAETDANTPPKGDRSTSGMQPLDEARLQFHDLVQKCFEVIRHADFIPHLDENSPDRVLFFSMRQSSLDELLRWKASLIAAHTGTADVATERTKAYLLMYWAFCYISSAACVTLRQTIFDDYMAQFAEIVEHATVYLGGSGRSTAAEAQPRSRFDPGVIPPLYFCATKCRDPILRRQALHLLRQAPRQQNLWAFVAPDRVVAKVIAVEEGEPLMNSSPREYAGLPLPPEERRFAYVSVVGRPAPGGIQRQALELCRFEFASDGSRKLISEYTWLDEAEVP